MILPVLKVPEYLSPSSLKEFENCEMKFYLRRMARLEYLADVQGKPAAVGSAFDCMVIAAIAQAQGNIEPEYQLGNLLKASVTEHVAEVVPYAKRLFESYVRMGAFKKLMDEGIAELHTMTRRTISDGNKEVPVLGKPDLKTHSGRVIDIKVNGAMSKSGQSPKPGYESYVSNMGDFVGPHDRCGEYLEFIDEDWATQLSIYTWLDSGMLPFRDIDVGIEQVAIRGDKFVFARIRTKVSKNFQVNLWGRLHRSWDKVKAGEISDPMPSKAVCHAYGEVCICSSMCDAYQKTFVDVDPKLKEILGN